MLIELATVFIESLKNLVHRIKSLGILVSFHNLCWAKLSVRLNISIEPEQKLRFLARSYNIRMSDTNNIKPFNVAIWCSSFINIISKSFRVLSVSTEHSHFALVKFKFLGMSCNVTSVKWFISTTRSGNLVLRRVKNISMTVSLHTFELFSIRNIWVFFLLHGFWVLVIVFSA